MNKFPLDTYIDDTLMKTENLWASSGSSNSVFKINIQDIIKITKGKIINII